MSIDPNTLVHRWFNEVWNQGREETVDELMAAGCIAHGLGEGADTSGPAGFKVFLRNMRSAFPDVHIGVEETLVSGDKVAARVTFEGTHLGDGIGIAATGRRVSIAGIVMIRVENGQVAEGWNSWDHLGLLRQVGAVPDPQVRDRFLSAPA